MEPIAGLALVCDLLWHAARERRAATGWLHGLVCCSNRKGLLYDINPVGVGAMGLAVIVSTLLFLGLFGPTLQSLSAFAGLFVAFVTAPAIA